MSPCVWNGSQANMCVIWFDGHLNSNGGVHGTGIIIRPVINLKADTQFQAGGKGTQNNPYIVQ